LHESHLPPIMIQYTQILRQQSGAEKYGDGLLLRDFISIRIYTFNSPTDSQAAGCFRKVYGPKGWECVGGNANKTYTAKAERIQRGWGSTIWALDLECTGKAISMNRVHAWPAGWYILHAWCTAASRFPIRSTHTP